MMSSTRTPSPRVGRVDHLAAADVQADVVGAAAEVEDQVAGLRLADRDPARGAVLRVAVVRQGHPGLTPRGHRQAGAVEGVRARRGRDVALADLREGVGDRGCGATAAGVAAAGARRAAGVDAAAAGAGVEGGRRGRRGGLGLTALLLGEGRQPLALLLLEARRGCPAPRRAAGRPRSWRRTSRRGSSGRWPPCPPPRPRSAPGAGGRSGCGAARPPATGRPGRGPPPGRGTPSGPRRAAPAGRCRCRRWCRWRGRGRRRTTGSPGARRAPASPCAGGRRGCPGRPRAGCGPRCSARSPPRRGTRSVRTWSRTCSMSRLGAAVALGRMAIPESRRPADARPMTAVFAQPRRGTRTP